MQKKKIDVIVQLKEQTWLRTYWRPFMAWQYFVVCIFDFIIFPLITFWLSHRHGVDWKWEPITMKDGGFYHMAMGVIVGVSAWQRGQENQLRTKIFGPSLVETEEKPAEDESVYIDDDDEINTEKKE